MTRAACTDRDLVERMRSGDEAALRDLYLSYGRRLFAHAFRLTGSADRAEDVVQDSLLAAWRATTSYRGDGSVLAWLLGHRPEPVVERSPPEGAADDDTRPTPRRRSSRRSCRTRSSRPASGRRLSWTALGRAFGTAPGSARSRVLPGTVAGRDGAGVPVPCRHGEEPAARRESEPAARPRRVAVGGAAMTCDHPDAALLPVLRQRHARPGGPAPRRDAPRGVLHCSAELELWQDVSGAVRADAWVLPGVSDHAWQRLASRHRASTASRVGYLAALVAAQVRVVGHGLWMSSAVVMALGFAVAWTAGRRGMVGALAPLVAVFGVSHLHGPQHDPAFELTEATPTSPRVVLLARLLLVFGYDLGLALAASAGLTLALPDTFMGTSIWLVAGADDLPLGPGAPRLGAVGEPRGRESGVGPLAACGASSAGPRPRCAPCPGRQPTRRGGRSRRGCSCWRDSCGLSGIWLAGIGSDSAGGGIALRCASREAGAPRT